MRYAVKQTIIQVVAIKLDAMYMICVCVSVSHNNKSDLVKYASGIYHINRNQKFRKQIMKGNNFCRKKMENLGNTYHTYISTYIGIY